MSTTTQSPSSSQIVIWSRVAVIATAWLFAAGGVVQVFLAGLSVFDSPAYWGDHVSAGRMIGVLAYLLPVLALVGRIGRRRTVLAFLVTALYILQLILANLNAPALAALHAVNALALIGLSVQVGIQTLKLVRSRD